MDLRSRDCKSTIKIGVIETYGTGKENAIIPYIMPVHERTSWLEHAGNVIAVIRHYVPNAEIHLVPPTTAGIKHLIENDVKIVNISLSSYSTTKFKELSNHAFLCIAAGNDGLDGESGFARTPGACAIGAVKADMEPQSYSSYGEGVVKTCAITGLTLYTGKALHGTSFAAPVIVGLLSQWYSWYKDCTGYYPTVQETNNFIKTNSHDIWEDGKDLRTGYGLLRLPHKFETKKLTLALNNVKAILTKISEGNEPINFEITLNIPPRLENDRTLIGSRDVAEAFGLNVQWHGNESYYIRG